ncbi:ABC transporter permease [Mogibacterium diversum]|nr:ABC transporter permease [Mogibacterium diversum]
MILYGGRASLTIGIASAVIGTLIAAVYGTLSGMANKHVDRLMMKATDLFMSIPALLLVIVLEAIWGEASYTSLSLVIGITSWMQMSKVIRSEVIRLRKSEFVIAAEMYGGSFWYILRRHLFPNYFSSIMFMAVSNVGSAIIVESTLSFMGLGLPISEISWGSLMSLSQDALLSDQWWMIIIPGLILISVLVSITEIGEYIRGRNTSKGSNI